MAENLTFKIGDLVQINVGSPSDPLWTGSAVIISFESLNRIRVSYQDEGRNINHVGNYNSWRLRHYVRDSNPNKLISWLQN